VIPYDLEAKILRLRNAEKWTIGTISAQLHVHRETVTRVLMQAGVMPAAAEQKASIAVPFIGMIQTILTEYPTLRASRLYEMAKARGYKGGPDHFRHVVARYRPRPRAEAYLRLQTLPGEQAQVDWGHFGAVSIGRAVRPLMAFVTVLSWSRRVFLRFYSNARMSNFLRGHVAAFDAFGGVPRVLLYDNLKSAVLERHGDTIRFNPQILQFSKHYGYEPRPVAVCRGNEKGRVERAIQYIRHAFFAARQWRDIDDLNEQAAVWCTGPSSERAWQQDKTMTVAQAFVEEGGKLMALPDNPYQTEDVEVVSIGKTPYARFDLNDYSVPHTYVRRRLTVHACSMQVRILDGHNIVATHSRSYDKAQTIEDPQHVEELVEAKAKARSHRVLHRLMQQVPEAQQLLDAVAENNGSLSRTVAHLVQLLNDYGAIELQAAVRQALAGQARHAHGVHQILAQKAHARGELPPLPVVLPDDARVKDASVVPHDLSTYDQLGSDVPNRKDITHV